MIAQQTVNLAGGKNRALLFPFDSISGPSPDQYAQAVQDIASGLILNCKCHTLGNGVTEETVKASFNEMVKANGGPAETPMNAKPQPPSPTDPPAPERTAPPRRK